VIAWLDALPHWAQMIIGCAAVTLALLVFVFVLELIGYWAGLRGD
jgi:hypothetical protein